ncbi:DUF7004 family protein [Marinilabilia salmonicolor]|uniref:DUF7004 family protein n=1 Tax=Marinilabilia salmonicolor TaxID=989 RepID=UPI00029B4728|nr:hypothetical protein [Marinilabilia salmonicolor]
MNKLVKNLKNNRKVVYDQGAFDNRNVWIVEADGTRKVLRDEEYLTDLYKISKTYAPQKLYNDFVEIYERTSYNISTSVLSLIDSITGSYLHGDQKIVEQWFSVIYAELIAGENEKAAILKKRTIRLALYQVLILGMPAAKAVNFSKGKHASELDVIMEPLGF